MSVGRTMRPWVPTLVFILIILSIIVVINYNSGSGYVIGEEETTYAALMRVMKGPGKPQTNPDVHWREALPWDIEPKRFLPNFFTYIDVMNKDDELIYRKSNIVYVHVARSGGTTMNTCLNQLATVMKSFDNTMRFITEQNLHNAHDELNGEGEEHQMVISGEFAFGSCDHLRNRPCSYVLLMRDPYERVISSYLFCQEYTDDESSFYCSLKTNDLSIVDWALLEGSPLFRQLVAHPHSCKEELENYFDFTNMIRAPRGIVKNNKYPCWMKLKAFMEHQLTPEQTDQLVQYVSDNMEYWFAAVGTLEKPHTLIQTMQDLYFIPMNNICSSVHKGSNTNMSKETKAQLLAELKADPRVAEALKADLLLYRRVKEVSKRQAINSHEYYQHMSI